ncbi:hypothetical protein [Niabella hibiscisoli]|uniref:hypothetical protein n=1 Tax=Niabella hibiscisoli TaxID=1825928 RepID=UPI001F1115B5|nr:hypothetical protein [Niabella hibiscisoli]MCH5720420.1 hypothetical protein [Niabella hibiscisoli]
MTIQNDGLVELKDGYKPMDISNVNNLIVSGAGTSGIDRGIQFKNNTYRAIALRGTLNDFTLQNMYFKNIADLVIMHEGLEKLRYTGAADSYAKNLKFLNLDADNVGPFIMLPGSIESSAHYGVIKGLEVANITCVNSPTISTIVYVGNGYNYNVHNNYINNVNTKVDNHNGIFFLKGFGKFYSNIVTNHQGNAIRAWIHSIDNQTGIIEIYNNIVYSSRRYGAFELQVTEGMKQSSVFYPVNAKVYNNTAGRLNFEDPKYFEARLLDLYMTYGTLEIYNNIVVNNRDAQIINNMSTTRITVNKDNIYSQDPLAVLVNLISFESKLPGIGANLKQ